MAAFKPAICDDDQFAKRVQWDLVRIHNHKRAQEAVLPMVLCLPSWLVPIDVHRQGLHAQLQKCRLVRLPLREQDKVHGTRHCVVIFDLADGNLSLSAGQHINRTSKLSKLN